MQGLLYFVKKAFYCWLAATSISIWNDASSKNSINRSYLSYSYTWYQIKKVFPKNVQWLIVNLLQNLSQLIFPILSITKFQITLELNAIVKKSFVSKYFYNSNVFSVCMTFGLIQSISMILPASVEPNF